MTGTQFSLTRTGAIYLKNDANILNNPIVSCYAGTNNVVFFNRRCLSKRTNLEGYLHARDVIDPVI